MKLYVIGLAFFVLPTQISGLSSSRPTTLKLNLEQKASSKQVDSRQPRKNCNPCEDIESDEVDRREAVFALVGAMIGTLAYRPSAADAYGQDAKMELPNVMEGITNRATKQCLVETLGNRECLVYLDPANKIYQGADVQVLLSRIETSTGALATIPDLIASKKWSSITGVLTGKMGTLMSTMNQLTKLTENEAKASDLLKSVKGDIIALSQFADRRQGDKALAAHKKATDDLVAFVESL